MPKAHSFRDPQAPNALLSLDELGSQARANHPLAHEPTLISSQRWLIPPAVKPAQTGRGLFHDSPPEWWLEPGACWHASRADGQTFGLPVIHSDYLGSWSLALLGVRGYGEAAPYQDKEALARLVKRVIEADVDSELALAALCLSAESLRTDLRDWEESRLTLQALEEWRGHGNPLSSINVKRTVESVWTQYSPNLSALANAASLELGSYWARLGEGNAALTMVSSENLPKPPPGTALMWCEWLRLPNTLDNASAMAAIDASGFYPALARALAPLGVHLVRDSVVGGRRGPRVFYLTRNPPLLGEFRTLFHLAGLEVGTVAPGGAFHWVSL